jgi:hypothetical protein
MFETRKKFPCSRVSRFLNLVHLIVHIRFVSKIGRCSGAVRKALLTAIAAAGIAKVPRRIQTAFGSKPKPRDFYAETPGQLGPTAEKRDGNRTEMNKLVRRPSEFPWQSRMQKQSGGKRNANDLDCDVCGRGYRLRRHIGRFGRAGQRRGDS